MGPVDVNDAVRHVLRLRRYSLDTANVAVFEDLDPALTHVWADRGQIEQLVLNLVVNAEQALADKRGDCRLAVTTRLRGDTATIEVADNGPGIPPAELDRIFDPFWTTKPPGVGLGLGLSIVHNIITDHRGRIRVDSEPGRGARFVIELPAALDEEDAGAGTDAEPEPPPQRALHILVVDDEPAIRVSLDRFLRYRGHHVDLAAEGEEALQHLDRAATHPFDVVISDLRMPGLPGEELFDALLARDPAWAGRIVFITGAGPTPTRARELADAGVPILHKPFDLNELARIVEGLG